MDSSNCETSRESQANSLGGRINVRITAFRMTDIRIIEVFCKEVLKGPENFIRINNSSNNPSSN